MGLAAYCLLTPVQKNISMKGMNLMTFTTWLIKEKGFVSIAQFDSLVNTLPWYKTNTA